MEKCVICGMNIENPKKKNYVDGHVFYCDKCKCQKIAEKQRHIEKNILQSIEQKDRELECKHSK